MGDRWAEEDGAWDEGGGRNCLFIWRKEGDDTLRWMGGEEAKRNNLRNEEG